MSFVGWRLSVSRGLKIHRGEESRVFSFFMLHVLLSLVIGMISTVVDPLVITHRAGNMSAIMYGLAALILFAIGLLYAGITDRIDKRRLFTFALVLSLVICVAAGLLLFVHDAIGGVPLLLPGLFVWRFVIGILLLLIFWDLAPFYFDARQGKRLFPLLAIGGALGYSSGSLVVVPLADILSVELQLFTIALVTVLCIVVFRYIRRKFTILDAPRYRDKSIGDELGEGMRAFRSNSFLRAVGWNTVVFGFLAGLIILTYNAVIDARTTTGSEAASLMGLQRAGATILQAVVLTKVMSQSVLGGRHKNAVIIQLAFFLVGIVAFAISMVGVADFTRQIEVALMSPAAMAAFAFLPSRYRGRVMVLNNIGAAALGIFAATAVVFFVGPYVDPLWFIYPIAALMVIRLAFNFVLNRRYVALISESILSDNRLNLARIEENTASILQDDNLLHRLYRETREQSRPTRMFITTRLARSARTAEDIGRIQPFFEWEEAATSEEAEALRALWIQTLARVDFDRYESKISEETDSPHAGVRIVARLAVLTRRLKRESDATIEAETQALRDEFRRAGVKETEPAFREICELILRLEGATEHAIVGAEWRNLSESRKDIFFQVVSEYPNVHYFLLLTGMLHEERFRTSALKGLKRLPETFLLNERERFASLVPREKLLLLQEMQHTHPVFSREESSVLLASLLAGVEESTDQPTGVLYATLYRTGAQIIDAGLLVLSDPAPVPTTLVRAAGNAAAVFVALYPALFSLRLDTAGVDEAKYAPLFMKLLDEKLRELSVLVLTLNALVLPREEDRLLGWSICRDLRNNSSPVKQNALEFLETRTEGDTKKYLLLFFESLTAAEKRAQLRSLLKHHAALSSRKLFEELKTHYLAVESPILVEIIENVAHAGNV